MVLILSVFSLLYYDVICEAMCPVEQVITCVSRVEDEFVHFGEK